MGYVSAKGGHEAILAAEELSLDRRLSGASAVLEVRQIEEQMRAAVDQVMGEGGLYAPQLAALAVKQAEGDLMEAAFLLRAYRTTLPRLCYAVPCTPEDMTPLRRISSAFKDVPGGQILGASRDFTLRLLDFGLLGEEGRPGADEDADSEGDETKPWCLPRVLDLMQGEVATPELAADVEAGEPEDVTTHGLSFPARRSARLQALARGETGAMTALAYASLRGYGPAHPTLAELRVGYLPLRVDHPYTGEPVTVGEVEATECQAVCSGVGHVEAVSDGGDEGERFALGYGLVFGRNERKAIAMSILDRNLSAGDTDSPCAEQEFVLYHIDGVDSMGFVEHLKLPHYVTYRAALDRLLSVRNKKSEVSLGDG
jgi:alpha-D-ribose 1-methylphosphonate 5-triphosphate synthase subunit PhnI